MSNLELLLSLKWYFELKNLSLKNILLFHSPLSVEQRNDLRLYYSQYFSALLSATELLRDKNYNKNSIAFVASLKSQFVFDEYTEGEINYSYLRELRNSAIHRGIDLTSSAHINNDNIPMMIAPSVKNQSGNKEYTPFGYYLIDIISKCEIIIPHIVIDHLVQFQMFELKETPKYLYEQSLQYLENSTTIPDWAKKIGKEAMQSIDFETMQEQQIKNCITALKVDILEIRKSATS
jgi:hypothetical protein